MVNHVISVWGKKILSLTLIFNALLSITYAVQLLTSHYASNCQVYAPNIADTSLFWAVILASVMNIFPAAVVGRVRTGRLWFHHYIYGLAVSVSSAGLALVFMPISVTNLFMANITDITVNAARFFILGGLTLLLDDLPDVSKHVHTVLRFVKFEAIKKRKIVHFVQGLMGVLAFYVFVAVAVYVVQHPAEATLANTILIGTLLVTALTSFAIVKKKTWLNASFETPEDQ